MDFVVGHPRSGTTYVTELLNAGGVALCGHELLAALSPDGVSVPTRYYEARCGAREVDALLARYAEATLRIDSNWKLAWILPPLLARFPDARVVHLVRDPRDNVRSCLELDFYGGLRFTPPFAGDTARNFWLEWMPRVRVPEWDVLTQLERNCAFWSETHRLCLAALEDHPRVLRVRLEDLVREPAIARGLLEFLDAPPPSESRRLALSATRVNDRSEMKARLAAVRPPPGAFETWPEADRATLRRVCGEVARAFGYDLGAP